MSAAGGLGFGLVTGWLAGRFSLNTLRPAVTIPAVSAGLIVVASADAMLAGSAAIGGYIAGAIVAISGSIAWCRWLEAKSRLGSRA